MAQMSESSGLLKIGQFACSQGGRATELLAYCADENLGDRAVKLARGSLQPVHLGADEIDRIKWLVFAGLVKHEAEPWRFCGFRLRRRIFPCPGLGSFGLWSDTLAATVFWDLTSVFHIWISLVGSSALVVF
jgi:hypothetical protein